LPKEKLVSIHVLTDCTSNLEKEINEVTAIKLNSLKTYIHNMKTSFDFVLSGDRNIIFTNKGNLVSLTIINNDITWRDI
jgi:hypothetical protein